MCLLLCQYHNSFDNCCFVVRSEIKECDLFNSVLSQDRFNYFGSFMFPYKFFKIIGKLFLVFC